jgi:imidazolonepropionase-like amidohydrolase
MTFNARAAMLALLASSFLNTSALAETKVLQNFNLIDGTGKPLAPNMAMVIVDGKIQSVGPNLKTRVPSGADVIDMTGKFIMPGIVNVHGHVGITKGLEQDAAFYSRDIIEDNLKTYAAYGVTTVVSLGTDLEAIYPFRNAQRGTRPTVARVYTAGKGFAMRGVNPPGPVRYEVLTPTDVEVKMAEHAKNKPDFVKLWMDDNFGRAKTITPELTNAIISSAKKHKLRVAAHIVSLAHAKLLIDQGSYALAHSVRDQQVDDALLGSMRKRGAWLIPTLTRDASTFMFADKPEMLSDPFFAQSAPTGAIDVLKTPAYAARVKNDPDYERWKNMLDMGERNLQRTAEAGVKIGLGTDSGAPGRFPGSFEHWEMDLMADSGLTASQIITIATKNGAEFIGANDLGTLEAGKWADLIVLNKNPLDNIRNTKTIEAVYLAGNKIKSIGTK